jgi:hypothetical protein
MKRVLVLATLATLAACKSDNNLFEQEGTDTWAQAPNNEVDILWVIDDSASMAEEQDTLADGFSSFGGQLRDSGADFHMGVITTSFDYDDPGRGELLGDPPYLTARDDFEADFAQRALVGIDGSDKEKGLEAATFALHPVMTLDGGPNEGFVRPDANLLVVIVSDEEDCSDNGALEGSPPSACYTEPDQLQPVTSYIQDLRDLKDSDDKVQVGAIVGTDGSVCPDVFTSERYQRVAALTGGLVGDICQGDWSNVLDELGLSAVGIRRSFQLSNAAKPETLQVFVDDDEVTAGWAYDEATWFITFDKSELPPRGSTITAQYIIQPGVAEPTYDEEEEGT